MLEVLNLVLAGPDLEAVLAEAARLEEALDVVLGQYLRERYGPHPAFLRSWLFSSKLGPFRPGGGEHERHTRQRGWCWGRD